MKIQVRNNKCLYGHFEVKWLHVEWQHINVQDSPPAWPYRPRHYRPWAPLYTGWEHCMNPPPPCTEKGSLHSGSGNGLYLYLYLVCICFSAHKMLWQELSHHNTNILILTKSSRHNICFMSRTFTSWNILWRESSSHNILCA